MIAATKQWLSRIWLFFNNRVAEPIHAHIRRVLNVPSWQELDARELRLRHAESTFLFHVESAEKMLLGREEAIHRLMTQFENRTQSVEGRIDSLRSQAVTLYQEAEHVASEVTITASDATVQLSQVIQLLQQVREYEKKKAKEHDTGRGTIDRSDAKGAARGSDTSNDINSQ